MALIKTLTDWITIQGDGVNVTSAVQAEDDYLEVLGASDCVIYVLINDYTFSSQGKVLFDTAPDKEETMFLPFAAVTFEGVQYNVPNARFTQYATGTRTAPPLSRWLRWRIAGFSTGAPWVLSMRIVVALNPSNYAPHLLVGPYLPE